MNASISMKITKPIEEYPVCKDKNDNKTINSDEINTVSNHKLATEAFKDKKADFYLTLFFAFAGALCASVFLLIGLHGIINKNIIDLEVIISFILFITILIIVLYGSIGSINSWLKLQKCYETQNYIYHHVEIENIEAGSHSMLWAKFTVNGKSYRETIKNYKTKYLHVFDCNGTIMYLEDTDNLLK